MNQSLLRPIRLCVVVVASMIAFNGRAGGLDELFDEYRAQGALVLDPAAGEAFWRRDFGGKSCTTCHTESPRNAGRHERTGKPIEPVAPSVNPHRLTDLLHVKKWLLRNCKSTLGRDCTAQEKGDVLTWLRDQ